MTSKRMPALLTNAVLAAALIVGVLAAPAQAALRQIRVNGTTEFERIGGFGALHKGLRIEVDAQRTDTGLVAKQIEPQRGGGSGGGGADGGPNHT
jgi:hypothetical protein